MSLQKTIAIPQVLLLSESGTETFRRALLDVFGEISDFYMNGHELEVSGAWGGSAQIRAEFTQHDLSPFAPDSGEGTRGLHDARTIAAQAHESIPTDGTMLIVTDVELVPPSDWRYIVWDV